MEIRIIITLILFNCLNSFGQNIEWKKTFGGSESEEIFAITKTPDGNIILGGKSSSSDGDVSFNIGRLL